MIARCYPRLVRLQLIDVLFTSEMLLWLVQQLPDLRLLDLGTAKTRKLDCHGGVFGATTTAVRALRTSHPTLHIYMGRIKLMITWWGTEGRSGKRYLVSIRYTSLISRAFDHFSKHYNVDINTLAFTYCGMHLKGSEKICNLAMGLNGLNGETILCRQVNNPGE